MTKPERVTTVLAALALLVSVVSAIYSKVSSDAAVAAAKEGERTADAAEKSVRYARASAAIADQQLNEVWQQNRVDLKVHAWQDPSDSSYLRIRIQNNGVPVSIKDFGFTAPGVLTPDGRGRVVLNYSYMRDQCDLPKRLQSQEGVELTIPQGFLRSTENGETFDGFGVSLSAGTQVMVSNPEAVRKFVAESFAKPRTLPFTIRD